MTDGADKSRHLLMRAYKTGKVDVINEWEMDFFHLRPKWHLPNVNFAHTCTICSCKAFDLEKQPFHIASTFTVTRR